MLKLIIAVRRHPTFTRREFFDYHKNNHTRVFFAVPEFMRYLWKYAQNHAILDEDGETRYDVFRHASDRDVVVPIWFESLSSMTDAFNEPKYESIIQPDERVFVDFGDPDITFLVTQEMAIHRPTAASGKLKLFEFINPAPGIDHATFLGRWIKYVARMEAEGVYARSTSGYACNIVIPTGSHPRWPAPRYCGVVETWFDSVEQMRELRLIRGTTPAR